jgi:hypothetical protein
MARAGFSVNLISQDRKAKRIDNKQDINTDSDVYAAASHRQTIQVNQLTNS